MKFSIDFKDLGVRHRQSHGLTRHARLDRFAYVNTTPGRDFTTVNIAESVGVNRGIRARVFTTIDEARTWIEKS
jgi:hypothetical protein